MQEDRKLVRAGLLRCAGIKKEIRQYKLATENAPSTAAWEEVWKQMEFLADAERRINLALAELSATEADTIRRHYFRGESWERIRLLHGYSITSIHRIASRALDKLNQTFQADEIILQFCRGEKG